MVVEDSDSTPRPASVPPAAPYLLPARARIFEARREPHEIRDGGARAAERFEAAGSVEAPGRDAELGARLPDGDREIAGNEEPCSPHGLPRGAYRDAVVDAPWIIAELAEASLRTCRNALPQHLGQRRDRGEVTSVFLRRPEGREQRPEHALHLR